jgi:hypothetical protein
MDLVIPIKLFVVEICIYILAISVALINILLFAYFQKTHFRPRDFNLEECEKIFRIQVRKVYVYLRNGCV